MRKAPLQDVIMKTAPPRRREAPVERGYSVPLSTSEVRTPERTVVPPARPRTMDGYDAGTRYAPPERAVGQEPPYRHHEPEYDRPGGRRWLTIALWVGGIMVLSSLALSFMFAGATVTASPKEDTLVVDASFDAAASGETGTIPFEQIVLERTARTVVTAASEEQVDERATGKLTLYNAYSETPQRLIKNTRFKSSDGKIFRIRESVEIPGKKSDTEPGSIEVAVFAEEPGDTYNIPAGDFSVPGFVGFPQDGKVYGKSSEPMAGGFSGIRRTIAESDRLSALEGLEQQLRDELLTAAFESKDKPEGYYLFKEAVFFEFSPLPDEITEGEKITLALSGKIHSVMFAEDLFAKRLAEVAIGTYGGSPIRIDNPYELTVTLEPKADTPTTTEETEEEEGDGSPSPAWESTTFTVKVQGKTHFIWEFDDKALARDLAGKERTVLDVAAGEGILGAYPGIDRIHATVRPFWRSSFPESPEDIVVLTELDA